MAKFLVVKDIPESIFFFYNIGSLGKSKNLDFQSVLPKVGQVIELGDSELRYFAAPQPGASKSYAYRFMIPGTNETGSVEVDQSYVQYIGPIEGAISTQLVDTPALYPYSTEVVFKELPFNIQPQTSPDQKAIVTEVKQEQKNNNEVDFKLKLMFLGVLIIAFFLLKK